MNNALIDSGIEWIGKIPKSWSIIKLKDVSIEINEKNNPIKMTNILSLTNTLGVVPYEDKGNQGNVSKDDLSQYKLAYKNTVIINSMNLKIGSVGLSNYDGCVSPVYYVLKNNQLSDIRYINYLFQSPFQKYLSKYGKGIMEIREKIPMYDVMNSFIPLPNLKTQSRICDYLDNQCKKIDGIIEDNKKEIDLLNEYRQSIINNTLSPKSDWKRVKIKNIVELHGRIGWQGLKAEEFIDEGPYLITGTDFDNNGGINWETCYHISEERYEEAKDIQVHKDDLLITKDGTVGKLAYIKELPDKTSLNSHLLLIRPINNLCLNKYLYWQLMTDHFIKYYKLESSGTIMESLTQETFSNYCFSLPSIKEQQKICNYLEDLLKKIDDIIVYRNRIIEKLDEFKKSLIYEVVTGKKEV